MMPTEEKKQITPFKEELVIDSVDLNLLEQQREIINAMLHDVKVLDGKQPVVITQDEHEALMGVMEMLDAWSDERYFAGRVEMTRENIQHIATYMAQELAADPDQLEAFVEDVITEQYSGPDGYMFFREDWAKYGADDE